jgi:hypothetical protein
VYSQAVKEDETKLYLDLQQALKVTCSPPLGMDGKSTVLRATLNKISMGPESIEKHPSA